MGRFEEVLPGGDQPAYSSIKKTRVTDTLLHVRTTAAVGGAKVSAMEYLHRDHLGSVEAVTDAGGASLLVQAYDPYTPFVTTLNYSLRLFSDIGEEGIEWN